jgi:hypothetical protein
MRTLSILYLIFGSFINQAQAGKKLKVLFIGNSYTYVNNMPQIIADIATSMGDTLIWDMEAPGGYEFISHFAFHPPTVDKIKIGNWNYVVLQEQSLTPALPDANVQIAMFPYARKLDSLIGLYNTCAETIFYMTWGRKNKDSANCKFYTDKYSWPYYCSYNGMDSLIRLRYRMMADSNQAEIAPAGAVWRYIRANYPFIELYDSDESHPSTQGSYAVACSFYTTLFKKNPLSISYDYTLSKAEAADIRAAAKKVVFDSMLYWHIGEFRTEANFDYSASANTISFTNTSVNTTNYLWYFGDGKTDTSTNPVHTYVLSGNYNVMLIAINSATDCNDTLYAVIKISPTDIYQKAIDKETIVISPNPSKGIFTVYLPDDFATVTIRNIYGSVIFSSITYGKISIDLRNEPKGVYIAHIAETRSVHECKLLIE